MPKPATSVNLYKKFKNSEGEWVKAPVEFGKTGKLKPDSNPTVSYYIEWRHNGQRVSRTVGKDPSKAVAERDKQQHILEGSALGLMTVNTNGNGRPIESRPLHSAIAAYVEHVRRANKKKTYLAYKKALDYFEQSCKKTNVYDVTRDDLLEFKLYCREKLELSPRTVANQFGRVVTFFIAQGVKNLTQKGDWPKYVEPEPEIYEDKEVLDQFFAACDEEEHLIFLFFLMTGMREQEVMHVTWPDLNLNQGIVRVTAKEEAYEWEPKAYKEREIPIPSGASRWGDLIAMLKAWHKKRDAKCPLVFPTKGCNPNHHFLEICKAVADRAKLNQDEFWLHKFRATFATWHLQHGFDLRTVQAWMGHDDLESTMRYLKPARSKDVQHRVVQTFA